MAAGGYMFILFWGRGCPLLALNTCDFRRAAAAAPPFFIIGGGTPRGTEAADLLAGGLGPDQPRNKDENQIKDQPRNDDDHQTGPKAPRKQARRHRPRLTVTAMIMKKGGATAGAFAGNGNY